jgi:NAD(P)-dependent dehydrogenase (short-subunit alcohol dehydrogenase family)
MGSSCANAYTAFVRLYPSIATLAAEFLKNKQLCLPKIRRRNIQILLIGSPCRNRLEASETCLRKPITERNPTRATKSWKEGWHLLREATAVSAAHQRTKDDIQHFTSREFRYTFETNVYAMFYLCKAALPHLQPGSSIINVASIQAYQPSPNLLAYAATKGAIVTFTKALADMAIEKGVRVNAVAPGPIWTPLIPSTMPKEKVKQFGKNTPMGRAGQPAELAPAFVFLASQDSSYITGEVLGVTGGRPLP